MSTDERMTIEERLKYLKLMKPRYEKASREGKSRLLDEMEEVTGLDRKVLIRRMNGSLGRKRRRGGRGRTYGADVDDALRVVSEAMDHICAERLTPNLVWMVAALARHGELTVSDATLEQLGRISISTVGRRLGLLRQDELRLARRGPRREKALLRDIPMLRLDWDIPTPGYFEVDLVHHCGVSAVGHYVCSTQWIDVATGWSERRAVLGRSQLVMRDAFVSILGHLPFPVVEIHPDNDSAFFNYHLLSFWRDLVPGVTLSRSRPYHKNDNPRVEQKNYTLIRAFLGYQRFDTAAHVLALNHLYDDMWRYYNFFQPVMHLRDKEVVRQEGQPTRIVRRHDVARTPFDRLCETEVILPEHRDLLEALRDTTNPRQLRQHIYDHVDAILAMPSATPGQSEDVFETLAHSLDFANAALDPLDFQFMRTPVTIE
jgi:hypothetical protein